MHASDILKARQIKAARALLDWSQDDLAVAASLSIATIRKVELGHISPRGQTTHSIRRALEDAGLEFQEPDGVRHRPDDIKIYQGQDGFIEFFDDVYQTARKKGGDVVFVTSSPHIIYDALPEYFMVAHIERMNAIREKCKVKSIITENGYRIPGLDIIKYIEYRTLSKNYVESVPFYVYDDKYAMIVFEAEISPKITILRSPVVAKAFRKMFYSMWDKATPIKSMHDTDTKK